MTEAAEAEVPIADLPFDPRRAMMVRMVDLQRSFAAEADSP